MAKNDQSFNTHCDDIWQEQLLFCRFTAIESFRGGLKLSLNPSFQTIHYYPKVSVIDLIRVVEKEDSVHHKTIFHKKMWTIVERSHILLSIGIIYNPIYDELKTHASIISLAIRYCPTDCNCLLQTCTSLQMN